MGKKSTRRSPLPTLLLIPLFALLSALPAGAAGAKLAESWLGTLEAGATKLRIAFHLKSAPDGSIRATVDSLDQGAMGLAVDRASYQNGTLVLELKALSARYEGKLDESGRKLTGRWSQGASSLPLNLEASDSPPVLRRPQEPKKPYPYLEEEVSYAGGAPGVTLAGTLTKPRVGGPFPAVLLITGSGPEDRDETIFGHMPFRVIADHLTKRGIAVLRVDDRGVGKSTAGPAGPTSEDFARDALAGVAFLKGRKEIDPKRIGLAGHSEGGAIAAIAAARSGDVAFVVSMAGAGLPGDRILHKQSEMLLRAMGAGDEAVRAARSANEKVYGILKEEKDPKVAETKVRQALGEAGMTKEAIDAQLRGVLSPWFRFFLTYDPRSDYERVTVPVLAIGGDKDLQVAAAENLEAIQGALAKGGNREVTTKLFPGLNHLFQPCKTGQIEEYAKIEQTFAPEALETISGWIEARFLKKGK